jgi:SAM-dependent methyltransferase
MTVRKVSYEHLAAEYYDSDRHPTCADFRHASLKLIGGYLSLSQRPRQGILEVGGGRSVFMDLAFPGGDLPARAVVTDRSEAMLRHSDVRNAGLCLVCADAELLPFQDGVFDLLIASLGDPYNTSAFWSEAARVLARGGRCLFTTPALEWSDRYRGDQQSGERGVAHFEMIGGATVAVPSIVLDRAGQMRLIAECGLTPTDVWTFTRDMFPEGTPSSPKIAGFAQSTTAVVCQYVARKSG